MGLFVLFQFVQSYLSVTDRASIWTSPLSPFSLFFLLLCILMSLMAGKEDESIEEDEDWTEHAQFFP